MNGSPWLDVHEAATYIGRSEQFVRRLVERGAVRAAHIDRRNTLRFRAEWLDAYIEQCAPAQKAKVCLSLVGNSDSGDMHKCNAVRNDAAPCGQHEAAQRPSNEHAHDTATRRASAS